MLTVALLFALQTPEPENARLDAQQQTCCTRSGCVEQSAREPCAIDPPQHKPPAAPPDDQRVKQELWELTAPIDDVAAARGLPVTPRGNLIRALTAPSATSVVIGEVLADVPFRGVDPDDGGRTILTDYRIRVLRVLRGELLEGEEIGVLYQGGTLSASEWVMVHDMPQCLPGDYGVFTFFESSVGPRIARRGTISMLSDVPGTSIR